MLFYSYAKINLFLNILNKRSDCYHNIESVFSTISIYDELDFYFSDESFSINLVKSDYEINNDFIEDNIITKTYNFVEKYYKSFFKGKKKLSVYLKKNIPIGAGLGGGSSNALTTIYAITKLYNFLIPLDELIDIASEIGADVPFFIKGGFAKVEGIGDKIETFDSDFTLPLIIIYPNFNISTANTYKLLEKCNYDYICLEDRCNLLINKIKSKDIYGICDLLYNFFENLQFTQYPILRKIKNSLLELGAISSLMSGTGSSIFGIFESKDKLGYVYNILKKETDYHIFSASTTMDSYF